MRNEAKYICCIGGFAGFLSFFSISLLLGEDALAAVLRGSIGCLFCSLCARGILHLILTSVSSSGNRPNRADAVTPLPGLEQEKPENAGLDVVRESTEVATAEAVSDPPPTVAETIAA